MLLHFSTVAWFLGGLALIAAAAWLEPGARLATSLCVGGLYLFGALANLWATRGRHPGWMAHGRCACCLSCSVQTNPADELITPPPPRPA